MEGPGDDGQRWRNQRVLGERLSRMLPDSFSNVVAIPTWPSGSRAGGSQSWAASDTARREGPEAARSCCCLPASGIGSWRWETGGREQSFT